MKKSYLKSLSRGAMALLASSLALGCSPSGARSGGTKKRAARDTLPIGKSGYYPTHHFDYSLLDGINVLSDEDKPSALMPVAGAMGAETQKVGGSSAVMVYKRITSQSDLASALNVDLGLRAKYAGASADASFKMANEWRRSANSITFLLSSTLSYEKVSKQQVNLTDDALALLKQDPIAFTAKYGTGWVRGVKYGPKLHLLVELTQDTNSDSQKYDAGLTVSTPNIGSIPVGIDVSSKFGFGNAVNNDHVQATISLVNEGFNVDDKAATALADLVNVQNVKIDDKVIGNIDAVVHSMIASYQADFCRDSGGAKCDSVTPSPGTAVRNAVTVGVELGAYREALNNPQTVILGDKTVDPWQFVVDQYRGVEKYVSDLCTLDRKIAYRLNSEIKPYLANQSGAVPDVRFNIAPPGTPLTNPTELVAVANDWSGQLSAADQSLNDSMQTCWDKALAGHLDSCSDADGAIKKISDTVKSYDQTARILPLFTQIDDINEFPSAKAFCAARGLKLPSRAEMVALAPILGYYQSLIGNPFGPHQAYADEPGACAPVNVDNGWVWPWNKQIPHETYSVYNNVPGTDPWFGCAMGGARSTICVPFSGPFQLTTGSAAN